MTADGRTEDIRALIERSSLGAPDARRARARVPAETGRTVARAAMNGRFITKTTGRNSRQG